MATPAAGKNPDSLVIPGSGASGRGGVVGSLDESSSSSSSLVGTAVRARLRNFRIDVVRSLRTLGFSTKPSDCSNRSPRPTNSVLILSIVISRTWTLDLSADKCACFLDCHALWASLTFVRRCCQARCRQNHGSRCDPSASDRTHFLAGISSRYPRSTLSWARASRGLWSFHSGLHRR
jgi:hypothetical protein